MSTNKSIVGDLVVDVVAACYASIGACVIKLVKQKPKSSSLGDIALALDHGYEVDLDDFVDFDQHVGFHHDEIGRIFHDKISKHVEVFKNGQTAHSDPVWEADYDRGIYSLFGRPVKKGRDPRLRRTRASIIVQRSMKDARSYRQAEKITKKPKVAPTYVTIPSPLNVASQLLSDPHNISSFVYSKAAILEFVRQRIEDSSEEKIDISFDAVSNAIELIKNRVRTSKPIVSNREKNGLTTIFLCNLLAIHGFMAMRIDIDEASSANSREDYFDDVVLGDAKTKAHFIINPHYSELPSITEVMNLIDGIPIGLEGAESIFQGGVRLSPEKSVVAALSGTFGAGKTLLSLSLAAAFAPLGCRTLYLSFEENAEDLEARMKEISPPGISRAASFYRAVHDKNEGKSFSQDDWFKARHLKLEQVNDIDTKTELIDPAAALAQMLEDTLKYADFFKPWQNGDEQNLPRFARPVIVVDGLHQLFDIPQGEVIFEASLRELVDQCRELGAIFIFSFSKEEKGLKRLEYLCDLIIELDHEGFENPSESPRRYFQLLKARRQPARIGAHVFHLKGENGFRLKPSTDARLQEAKRELWSDPDYRSEIFLTETPPDGFTHGYSSSEASNANSMAIRNWAQILVIGKGSSGKAGFGLYLLHRRWFDRALFSPQGGIDQLKLLEEDVVESDTEFGGKARELAISKSKMPVWYVPPYLETRVLVISFLYQSSYYDVLSSRLSRKQKGKVKRAKEKNEINPPVMGPIESLAGFEYCPLPDKMRTDTIELYPGMLGPEDFIAKIEKKLSEAESVGMPYTGVLVDGLHNVFVQFPKLEESSSFWGTFYNLLRRRKVTVVTTHTEFSVKANEASDGNNPQPRQLTYNFEQAQRKVAPLLSALISGADYLFDLSPHRDGKTIKYVAVPRTSIGQEVGNYAFQWDRKNLRLEGTTGPYIPKNS